MRSAAGVVEKALQAANLCRAAVVAMREITAMQSAKRTAQFSIIDTILGVLWLG